MRETSKKMTATERARPFARFAFEATVADADDDVEGSIFVSDGKIVRADLIADIVSALQPHIAKVAFAYNFPVAEYEQEIFDDLHNLSEETLMALAVAAKARRS